MMHVVVKIIKWIITATMGIIFIVSALGVIMPYLNLKILPKNVNELALVKMTVKTAFISQTMQFITPQEYPIQLEINGGYISDLKEGRESVKPGNTISIYFRNKEEAELLEDKSSKPPPVMMGFGIVLRNGKILVDPHDTISGKTERSNMIFYSKIIALPTLWFLCLIFFPIVRKQYKNQKPC